MKHIKLFNESNKELLYSEISSDEWNSYLPFTIDPDKRTLDYLISKGFDSNKSRVLKGGIIKMITFFSLYMNPEYLEVNCLPDDYYLIGNDDIYYKCDTIDGLKQYLNSIILTDFDANKYFL